MMFKILKVYTAGESHGKMLVGILSGFPAGFKVNLNSINKELVRRQRFYGRGKRMNIEKDEACIVCGLRKGVTLGSPIAFLIFNKDQKIFPFKKDSLSKILNPRPGHADLAGILKYGFNDIRNVWERSSARNTASLVVCGALCKQFLKKFDIDIFSYTLQIGDICINKESFSYKDIKSKISKSPLNCPDRISEKKMISLIKEAENKGDSLGGIFEVVARGVIPGLGSYVDIYSRLDTRIGAALLSIPAVKGVEFGLGFELSKKWGSESHDEIYYSPQEGFWRKTNNAGGIEGGMSNGEDIVARCVVKPVPSLSRPLKSVNIITKKSSLSSVLRSDLCIVPSAGVIAENMLALVLMDAFLEKFGQDRFEDIKANFLHYKKRIYS